MIKPTKEMLVAITSIFVPDTLQGVTDETRQNFREFESYTLTEPRMASLYASIANVGQQDPLYLKKDGVDPEGNPRYSSIRGNRRTFCLTDLAAKGVIDPRTVRYDEKGEPVPNTGKPFTHARALVFDGLTQLEELELRIDERETKPLDKAELFYAWEIAKNLESNERKLVIKFFGLLTAHWPPKAGKVIPFHGPKSMGGDEGVGALANWKGVVDTFRNAMTAPTILRAAFIEKLRGKQHWPTNKDLGDGCKVYESEYQTDKINISRGKPGPKFLAWFENLTTNMAKGAEEGKRAKSVGALGRPEIEKLIAACDSKVMKIIMLAILRDPTLDSDILVKLNEVLTALETGKIDAPTFLDLFNKLTAKDTAPATDGK